MEPDYSLMICLGLLFIAIPGVKSLMEMWSLPALAGYILLGFAVSILDGKWAFSTPLFDQTFAVLAQLGVFALLFRVGLKSHTKALLAKLPDASLIWVGDVLTNLIAGYGVAYYLLGLSLETALMIATAFSATSVAVSVAVWNETGKLNSPQGQLLVDVAELDDLSGVLLLSVVLALIPVIGHDGNFDWLVLGSTTLFVLMKLILFISGCFLFANYLEAPFTRFNRRWDNSAIGFTIAIMGAGLAIAAMAGVLGFSLAIGALFAGLAFSRDPQAVRTDGRFVYFYEFLTPFFFIHIGMQVEPAVIVSSLGLGMVLLIPAVLGKLLGVALPALRTQTKVQVLQLGISMIPRAEIAMVVVYQCRQLGGDIVPASIFGAMVVVSLVTSLLGPLLLKMSLRSTA